jgi:hypothetical protein
MSNFNPQPVFTVQLTSSGNTLLYRFSFYMPTSAGVRAQGRTAFLKTSPDAAIEISTVADDAADPRLLRIVASVPGTDPLLSAELGTVRFAEDIPPAQDLERLVDAIGQASYLALSSVSVSAGQATPVIDASEPPVDPLGRAIGVSPSRLAGTGTWLRARRWSVVGLSTVVLAGIVFIGYGILHKKDESFAAVQGGDYSDLQEKVRKQIELAAKSGSPAIDSLQGQNVAIATMKAMGLDPGKANAGCLVGVK